MRAFAGPCSARQWGASGEVRSVPGYQSSVGEPLRVGRQRVLACVLGNNCRWQLFGGVDLGTGGAAVFEVTSQSDDEEFIYPLPDGSVVVIPATIRRSPPGNGHSVGRPQCATA